MRAWKIGVALGATLLVAGLLYGGYAYKAKLDRLSQFVDRARAVQADLVTLRHGAQTDAALIVQAFDDKEVRKLLHDQDDVWSARVEQCASLGQQVDDLVPQNDEQAADEISLERDLATLASAAKSLSDAVKRDDPFAARLAAAQLAPGAGNSK